LGCFAALTYLITERFWKNKLTPSDLVFSLSYVVATTLLIVAYRDGNLYSLNRFIYATPFITILIYYFLTTYNFAWKHVFIMLIATELLWLTFNSYTHLINWLFFSSITLYFILLLLLRHPSKQVSLASFTIL